jgi:hypothetical protein
MVPNEIGQVSYLYGLLRENPNWAKASDPEAVEALTRPTKKRKASDPEAGGAISRPTKRRKILL